MSKPYSIYEKLSAIGVCISSAPYPEVWGAQVDIEKTMLDSAEFILSGCDSRILSLVLAWIKRHGELVNIGRLKKLMDKDSRDLRWINLCAFYGLFRKQSKWKILAKPNTGSILANGDIVMVESRAQFKGEESWSRGSGFLIPLDSEPAHEKYALSAQQIASINIMFRNRLIFGAAWRADIVTAVEFGARTPTEVCVLVGASYESSNRVMKELATANFKARSSWSCFHHRDE